MQALKLSKKYPEFKQDEIFDLVNKFKYVPSSLPMTFGLSPAFLISRQIDVEDKGSLDKASVIAALGQSGDADYDSVCPLF
jgi:plastin-1